MAVLSCGVVLVSRTLTGFRSLRHALAGLVVIAALASSPAAQVPATPATPAAGDVRLGAAARQERLGLHHIR